jgi:carbon starvation protein
MVGGWGYFLIHGVRDPLGGINSLWPLFWIANQLLAAIALCLCTTILLKMSFGSGQSTGVSLPSRAGRAWLPLVTLVPLLWLLAVTMTAGLQKIFDSDPRIGFLAQANALHSKTPVLEQALSLANAAGSPANIEKAAKALRDNQLLRFNNILDALVAAGFLALVAAIILLSAREWTLLLRRRKPAVLRESEPVWLPEYALPEGKSLHLAGPLALALALTREWSGEAYVERARQSAEISARTETALDATNLSAAAQHTLRRQLYLKATEERFQGIRRCC